jgi:DNA-binding transcriptional ArsR family regulator
MGWGQELTMDTNSLVSIAKALSGPTCRRLLQEITKGDIDVGADLFQYISISQPPTSQHLNFLAVAGLVESHKQGRKMYTSINA